MMARDERRRAFAFGLLLYVVGGGLIWAFYGWGAMLVGWGCITGGGLFFTALYGLVWLVGCWVGE